MGNFTNISNAIVTVLTAVQQNSQPAFADIQKIPTLVFAGWPAATVTPADNLSEYANIVENFRTYVFDIDLYYPIQEPAANGGYSKAFSVMLDLVDTVLDALDNSNDLNNAAEIIRPVPSVWSMVQTSAGDVLTARITMSCAKTVSQNNG